MIERRVAPVGEQPVWQDARVTVYARVDMGGHAFEAIVPAVGVCAGGTTVALLVPTVKADWRPVPELLVTRRRGARMWHLVTGWDTMRQALHRTMPGTTVRAGNRMVTAKEPSGMIGHVFVVAPDPVPHP